VWIAVAVPVVVFEVGLRGVNPLAQCDASGVSLPPQSEETAESPSGTAVAASQESSDSEFVEFLP
jgi:hypothetical protein